MSWFEYEGFTAGGTLVTGQLEVADLEAARLELARMNLDVTKLQPVIPTARPPASLNADELMFFNQQLAGLARAGMALDDGLAQLAKDVQSHRLRRWIEDLVMDLRRGVPIDQALAARESGLPVLYSQVVRAGIETGKLPLVLLNLNQHLQTTGTTRRILWEAASYPLVLGLLGLGVISFFFTLVVPQFRGIFADFQTNLPALTRFALTLSENFVWILITLAIIVGGVVVSWWMLRGTAFRERLLMLIPIVGGIHRSSLVARFLRAVSAAVETNIPLPAAVRLSSDATGSRLLRYDGERLAGQLEAGRSVLEASRDTQVIPPLFGYCVQAATSRACLPASLGELARTYEDRVLHGHGILRVLLLPIFILIIGAILLFAVVAMFLPLVSLINSVSGV